MGGQDSARYLDIEQMVKRELRDAERVYVYCILQNGLGIREQQAILEICVVVDGKQSSLIDVVSGVPQGTILGPLLFLLHINDLPSVVSSKVRLFADDCLIYRNIKNKEDCTAKRAKFA